MQKLPKRADSIETTVLANGVKIITETMPHVRSVSLGIWLRSGSRRETEEENGISHFLEHMVFKATEKREAEEIARELDRIGGHMDAFTSREMVCYNAKVLEDHVPLALDVLTDLVRSPLFRDEDIQKEKGVVLEEIKMDLDNPEYQTHEIFCRNFWKGNALGRPILGTPKTVRSFDSETLRKHWKKHYIAPNLLVTAAGRLNHKKFVKMVEAELGGLPKRKPLSKLPTATVHPRITMKDKASLEQAQLCLGAPAYPIQHEKRVACHLLNNILGAGMSSRLFQNIREKQGLVYSIGSDLNLYSDTGCLGIYAGTSPTTLRRVVESIVIELRRMKDEPPTEDELRRAKDNLKGSIVLGLESTSSRMSNLARQEIFFGCFADVDEVLARIEEVQCPEVQEIANTFLKPQNLALTVLGPLRGETFTRKDLAC